MYGVKLGNNRLFFFKKRFFAAIAATVLALGLALSLPANAITVGGPSDCDANAIIRCGDHTTSALIKDYNASSYVQKVYSFFGISAGDMASLPSHDVAGYVTRGGDVFVNGSSKPVATNALTGGRQNIAGSRQVTVQGATFFVRPPSVSFQSSSLPAFVSMSNGRFQFAIIASCGNAVKATPVKPPKPAPTPPRPTPAPTPAPTTPTPPAAPPATPATSQSININNQNVNQNVNQQSQSQTVNQAPPAAPVATQSAPAVQSQVQTTPVASSAPTSALPNTGAGSLLGVFGLSSLAGMLGYRRLLIRRRL